MTSDHRLKPCTCCDDVERMTAQLNAACIQRDALREALDEAHAAIRALVYMGEVYDTATAHAPYDCQCFRCDTLKKHAPAIARATNQPTQPDREPPFHFCDQIRENLVGPKSACEFCRATGEEP
jgi:hypothetical protein